MSRSETPTATDIALLSLHAVRNWGEFFREEGAYFQQSYGKNKRIVYRNSLLT